MTGLTAGDGRVQLWLLRGGGRGGADLHRLSGSSCNDRKKTNEHD